MQALLDGLRGLDLAGEPAAITGRVLADLGADVVLVEPPGGHPLRQQPHRWSAWSAGKRAVEVSGADDPRLDALLEVVDARVHAREAAADVEGVEIHHVIVGPFGVEWPVVVEPDWNGTVRIEVRDADA